MQHSNKYNATRTTAAKMQTRNGTQQHATSQNATPANTRKQNATQQNATHISIVLVRVRDFPPPPFWPLAGSY